MTSYFTALGFRDSSLGSDGMWCHVFEFSLVATKVPRAALGDKDRIGNVTILGCQKVCILVKRSIILIQN